MKRRFQPTLLQLFFFATVLVAVAVASTFTYFVESSRRSIVRRSESLRDAEARRIDARLTSELDVARRALDDIERSVRFGTLAEDDQAAVEARLFSEMLDLPALSDVAFTRATPIGYDAEGYPLLAAADRWQVSVYRRSAEPDSALATRRIRMTGAHFLAEVRARPKGGELHAGDFAREGGAPDPTAHATFQTTAARRNTGRALWSDLHFSELDAALPASARRVVVTVQQALRDQAGQTLAVVRVGLSTHTIDSLPRSATVEGDEREPQRIFLCDTEGRLVARLDPEDRLELSGDDLRVVPAHLPAPIARALSSPSLRALTTERPEGNDAFDAAGVRYLATFRALPSSQGWIVGVVVPEGLYTRDLRDLRRRFLVAFLVVAVVIAIGGGLVLREIERAFRRIAAVTARMRHFDFAPASAPTPFRDVAEVFDGLERAKTAMRALGKYVPIDLVRELYEANREPVLGGELREISMMFTDIEGFTNLSERMPPDALARALGRYLEAMTEAIRSANGTVDKFIGDAVMALWNAPTPTADHASCACRAALGCIRATGALYASPQWSGIAPLFTRFGLHRARVMVGHFGAPERLGYTALGDGVNLTARLESLCKHYGIAILASHAVYTEAKRDFCFRLVDKVAVKGKTEAVLVYELLGARGHCDELLRPAAIYELALEAYFARDFAAALALLEPLAADAPSRVLRERCRKMAVHPPPEEWNGIYAAETK
ncbi:MAG: hypothetical protein M3O36_05990 [Myxococcota bacterium]|nr:hypothetical protein [Myxococcota bacterium]